MIHVSTLAARGAYGVAPRWRKRRSCPHRSDEQSGQDEGDRGKFGSERETPNYGAGAERLPRAPSVCVLFALVNHRFALGRTGPAQGSVRQGDRDELNYFRTRKRSIVTGPDRLSPHGSRSIRPRPEVEKRTPSPSSTGKT